MQASSNPANTQEDVFCPQCLYNMRGNDSGRCPECGKAVTSETLVRSTIPWVWRRQIGPVRAFFDTVIAATFRPRQLACSLTSAGSRWDGRAFRRLCVLPFWVALSVVVCFFFRPNLGLSNWIYAIPVLALAGFFISISLTSVRAMSFAKWPDENRNAILSASEYLSGAFLGGAVLGAATALLPCGILVLTGAQRDWRSLFAVVAIWAALCSLIIWLSANVRFMDQLTRATGVRCKGSATLPAVLLLAILDWLIAVPLLGGLLYLIVASLLA